MTNRLSSLLGHLSSLARDLPESCKINGLDVSMEDGGEISATVVISSVNDDQEEPSGEALGYDFGTVPAGDHSAKVTSVERGDQGRLIVGIDIGGQITKSVVNEPAPLPEGIGAKIRAALDVTGSVGKLQQAAAQMHQDMPLGQVSAPSLGSPNWQAFVARQNAQRAAQQAALPGVPAPAAAAIAESAADRLRNWRRDASNIMAQMREEVGDDNPVYTDEEASLIALLDEVNTDIAARRRDAKAWRQHADNLEERLAKAQQRAELAERQVEGLTRLLDEKERLLSSYGNTVDDLNRQLMQAQRDAAVAQQAASQAQGDAVPQGWQEVQS